MPRTLLTVVLLSMLALPARAERLVTSLSNDDISITSTFDGEVLTLFGNIEPDVGASEASLTGTYDIVIVIEGPLGTRVARQKTQQFGIWLNSEQVEFREFPSFYQLLTSGRLADIADPVTLATETLTPAQQARKAARDASPEQVDLFGGELVRLMEERGLFRTNVGGVQFLSRTAYTARVELPSDVPNGRFLARTYMFHDGEIVARKTEGFTVRKVGFERFLAASARQQPLAYGLACVALALFTGWLGGVVFRR